MKRLLAAMLLPLLGALPAGAQESATAVGVYRAWLDCPGGELPFGLEVERAGEVLRSVLVNGSERIDVPITEQSGERLLLSLPHYDSVIEATLEGGGVLEGTWRKRRSRGEWTEMPFHASAGPAPRFRPAADTPTGADVVDGRWFVRFESSEDPAVGIFETLADGSLLGTFLTSTGDYRFLSGDVTGDLVRLSCFDGAHAFLFTARLAEDGTLAGDFWSRDTWHETWTATRDESAAIPDPYDQTEWKSEWALADAVFPDLEGRPRSLDDPEFAGRARMLVAFGSWCPNCHDEAPYLAQLQRRYGERGLSILGLAFELTGEFERDAEQVRRFAARHGVEYPILVAGTADKEKATRAFPMLDFVRSYPTTIFLHADGRVRAVHSGFTGPATGEAWDEVQAEFEGLIEELLAEEPPTYDEAWAFLEGRSFVSLDGGETYEFEEQDGTRTALGSAWNIERLPVRLSGDALFVDGEILRVDREAGILFDPRRFERRFAPVGGSSTPSIRSGFLSSEKALAELAENGASVLRREALVAIAELRHREGLPGNPIALEYVRDEELSVQLAAVWSLGRNRVSRAVPALIDALSDPNAALRRESALALGRISAKRPDIRSALDRLANDPDPLVREAAAAPAPTAAR